MSTASSTPLISVVLPTHNGMRYLDQSIESVVAQDYPNWELIVVNDASTDQTPGLIDAWASKDSRIVAVHLSANRRLPGALNEGFRRARGELLTWTSDDNVYDRAALATLASELASHPDVAIVYAPSIVIDENGVKTGEMPVGPAEDLILGNCVGACFLYRREVHEKLSGYREEYFLAEDYDFWLRACLSFRMRPLDHPLYFYRRHAQALTSQRLDQVTRVTEQIREEWLLSATHLPLDVRLRYCRLLGIAAFNRGDGLSGRRFVRHACRIAHSPLLLLGYRSYLVDFLLGARCGRALRAFVDKHVAGKRLRSS